MWVGAACCLASGELFTANFETDSLLPGLSPPTQLDSQLGEFAVGFADHHHKPNQFCSSCCLLQIGHPAYCGVEDRVRTRIA